MEPNAEGVSKVPFASIWHPNGLHQTLPVGLKTRFSGIHTSPDTGLEYFTMSFLDLPVINASFTFEKWFQDGEVESVPEQKGRYITIMQSHGEGIGQWNDKEVKLHVHVEQLQLDKIDW